MGPDSLYCGKWRKTSKSCHDLDLGPAMPNMELVRDMFIYYDVFKFHVHRSITFLVIMQKHRNTHTHTHADSDEYSIVAFCKIPTIIKCMTPDFYKIESYFKVFHINTNLEKSGID